MTGIEYIFTKPYKGRVICGEANIPQGMKARRVGTTLYVGDKPVALANSDFAYRYTARNDDGHGEERASLIEKILHQQSLVGFAKFTDKEFLLKFRRQEHDNVWLWNSDFYNAGIEDLKTILNITMEV